MADILSSPKRDKNDFNLIRIKKSYPHHVSMSDVSDLEESFLQIANFKILKESVFLRKFIKLPVAQVMNLLLPKYLSPVFCISMGARGVNRGFPYLFLSDENFLFLFDAWPGSYKLISRITKVYNIKILFITSKQSANILGELLPDIKVIWCPEGIKFENYKAFDYSLKDIDIIQIGRKYEKWHYEVVDKFNQLNIKYFYELKKGDVIFPLREDFINGLGRSKISVCFPKSVTHPDDSGGLSTMTHRFLQSMASKCLVVGQAPEEMKECFGYDPVIEADMNDPAGQIIEILNNYSDYLPLIEKNYTECMTNHNWEERCKIILDALRNNR
jgi:hypothetical protein